jgi:autotransporter-associated beta strand protein
MIFRSFSSMRDVLPAWRTMVALGAIAASFGMDGRTAFGQATWNGSQSNSWANQLNWSGTSAANLVNSGTSAIVFAGSTQLSTTNTLSNFQAAGITFDATAGNFTLSGSAIRSSANITNLAPNSHQTINLNLNVTAAGRQFTGTATGTTTYAGNFSGSGGMSFRTVGGGSTAVHIVSGSNSHQASTEIGSAIVIVDNVKALSTGTITFGGGGLLRSNVDLTGTNRLTNSAVTFTNANNRATFTGANSFEFAAALRSNNNATVTNDLDAGKTVTFGGLVAATANAATSGTVTFTGAAKTVISGNALDGPGITLGITKTGLGTLVLAGTNNYSAPTTVTAGKLYVNGDSSAAVSAITVSSSATLGGSGSIGGLTTISGTLDPGADAGTVGLLEFTNTLTLNSASRSLFAISGTSRGVGYDAVNVATLTYGGTLDLSFSSLLTGSFNLFGTGGSLSKTGNLAGIVSGGAYGSPTWTRTNDLWTATSGANTLTFDQLTGTLVVVPEPASLALAGIGVSAAGWLSRRRVRARRRAA